MTTPCLCLKVGCSWVNSKRPIIVNTILKQLSKISQLILYLVSRLLYNTTIIKTVGYWQKNSKLDQWNRTENPEIDSHKYRQLTFEIIQWRKNIFNKIFWNLKSFKTYTGRKWKGWGWTVRSGVESTCSRRTQAPFPTPIYWLTRICNSLWLQS